MGAFLQRRHDQCRAGHRPFQHRMRSVALRQRGRRDRRKADRLADKSPPDLFKHQGKFGEAETETIRRTRHENAQPSEFSGLPQLLRREAYFALTKSTRDFRPCRASEFRGVVAQQGLLRSQMQLHESLPRPRWFQHINSAGSERGEPRYCAGSPTSRHRWSRAAPAGTALRHPPRRNQS